MGGYDAGEVAAALAIQTLRKTLLQHKMFAALAGETPPEPGTFYVDKCKKVLHAALKEANRTVYQAPRNGIGRRGMGCTAEAVYVDGENIIVGHVGDSRTYHLHQGRLIQMTRDQTLRQSPGRAGPDHRGGSGERTRAATSCSRRSAAARTSIPTSTSAR